MEQNKRTAADAENIYRPVVPPSFNGKFIISALMLLFLAVTSYKLTNASLWFDEGVEYLISVMPFSKMIPAIKGTFQPPLYNFILHFLLRISTSEIWFRFTSVLFGFAGCAGLYCAVNEAAGWKAAGVSVFFYMFLRNSIYYNQECAEYTLVVCALFWTVYFFICLLRRFSYAKSAGFTICCVLSMYSQYGALFPLLGLSLSVVFYYVTGKQWLNLKRLVIMMGTAVITFGIPLYFCFIRFQRAAQSSGKLKAYIDLFDEIQFFIQGLKVNFSYFFSGFYQSRLLNDSFKIFYLFAVCAIVWSLIQPKNRRLRYAGLSAAIAYFAYHVSVRLGIYAYGAHSGRYVLPVLPLVLVCLCLLFCFVFRAIYEKLKKKSVKFAYVYGVFVLILLCFHNYANWTAIQKNWEKNDVRAALNLWLDETDGTEEMYLYYAAVPVFSFYAENRKLDYGKEIIGLWGSFGNNIDPQKTQYRNFHYGENLRGRNVEDVKISLQKSFSGNMPDHLWFMLSHINPDNKTYMDAFSEMGYGYKVYRWNDARLLWLCNAEYLDKNYSKIIDGSMTLRTLIMKTDQIRKNPDVSDTILFNVEGRDPKIFLSVPGNIRYDRTKAHYAVIEFSSDYAGNIQLFFRNDADFSEKNSVKSQYAAGRKKIMLEIPQNVSLDLLRLDIDNSNVPANGKNEITLQGFSILE